MLRLSAYLQYSQRLVKVIGQLLNYPLKMRRISDTKSAPKTPFFPWQFISPSPESPRLSPRKGGSQPGFSMRGLPASTRLASFGFE